MSYLLEADGIQLAYNERKILSAVYLACEEGKITGLLGRNGEGKSSLMQIIYGSLACEKSVRINAISRNDAYKKPHLLRYLPQFNFIPKTLSLKQIFNDFELNYTVFQQHFPEFISKYKSAIGSLSGGERRLIELYAILKSDAHFVMLDEPFTHLNPLQIEKVKALLVEEKRNKGLLITDHMYKHVIEVCDDFYILTNGQTYLAKSIADLEAYGYARL